MWIIFFLFMQATPASAVVTPVVPGEWDLFNEPQLILQSYEKRFSALPLKGSVEEAQIPWSDSYWQNNWGGIGYQWNSPWKGQIPAPDRDTALTWSETDLSRLSPAQKYDLYLGHYDYPLTARVAAEVQGSAYWEGICHGWSVAALHFVEPTPVIRTNPDGIVVPFGASDVKALLSYYYAWDVPTPAHNLGLRCNSNRGIGNACGDDANAGAFHIILTNQLGLKHEGFIADVDRGPEVWNQPVYAFESSIISEMGPGRDSAAGTVKQVLMDTYMTYTEESPSQWEPVSGTEAFRHTTVNYRYWLELNESDEIIGGLWESHKRPDFIWTKDRTQGFTGDWAGLEQIYHPIH